MPSNAATARLVQKLKRSRGVAVAVVEHSAETLAPPDLPIRGSNLQCWLDNSAIESLMVSLKVVILEILVDHTSQLELPVGEKSYQKITRGHLASNVEMKSLGDPEEGLQAQKDSFSLANVVPQMQRHNAPIWAKLEDDCMEAAKRLGTTAGVVSRPVYAPDAGLPVPGNEVLFTAGRDGVAIPIPTHFFKVVIAQVNGKRVAVGFLIPHRADFGVKDLGRFTVPVRVIEGVTGIDFMPELKANDEVESKSEARWFGAISANVTR